MDFLERSKSLRAILEKEKEREKFLGRVRWASAAVRGGAKEDDGRQGGSCWGARTVNEREGEEKGTTREADVGEREGDGGGRAGRSEVV